MFSLLEVDGTTVNTIVGIIGTLVTIVFGLPAVISGLLFFIRSLNIKKFYDVFFRTVLNSRNPNSWERYRFMHYIKHSFTLESFQTPQENILYKEFIKIVKNTKIVILTGSAGVGKSILMQRLALNFRSKIQKDKSGQILDDYGVLFYKLNRQSDLKKIINEIEEKIKSSSIPYSLYLDGLDEISELSVRSGAEILNDLLSKLLNGISQKCNRIFISLRPEILDGGYSFAQPDEEDNILIFKIQNFNKKQIMAMYHNENHNHTTKTKLKVRIQNFKKLKFVIKNNPESVFTYPLILTWANQILSDYNIKELTNISWYDALGKVIDKELEREYNLYRNSKGVIIGPTSYSRDQFINDGKEFLTDIALKMALSNSSRISRESILANVIVKQFNKTQNETTGNTFLTRRLLRYMDWSEKSDFQPYYEFIHNTIYWRVLAGALLNPNTPQNVRGKIILTYTDNKYSTPLLPYCIQGLWSLHRDLNKIFPYADYSAYMRAIDKKVIECRTVDNTLPLEVILSCFYKFNEVSCDYSFRFNFCQIEDFVKDRKLNLANTNITDLTILNNFSNNSFDFLDCSNSNIAKADIPNYIKEISFYKCISLTDVIIPNSMERIKEGAFYGCTSLKSIIMTDSVKNVEKAAFYGCTSLKNIILPESLTSIGFAAFQGCISLRDIKIPNSVTNIEEQVFGKCTSLINITLPKDLTCIAKCLCAECSSLATIAIPDKVTSIEERAFRDCSSLIKIKLSDSLIIIGEQAFSECTSLTDITIPESVTNIGITAFCKCKSLKNITLPEGLTSIEATAFSECTSLTTIKIPDRVTNIGEYAFLRCTALKNITIPNSVKNIEKGVFAECTSLTNITIPNSVKSIGSQAFLRCASLTTITIPDSVIEIEEQAFVECKSLKNITLPEGLTSIGATAFAECTSLTTIKIPDRVTNIGEYAFAKCTSLSNIKLPDSLTNIEKDTFWECTSLKSIIIPDKVKSIGELAFNHCISLETIIIPDSVTSIEEYAFCNCLSLKNFTIPNSVTSIEDSVFKGCSSLSNIVIPKSVKHISKSLLTITTLEKITYNGTGQEWLNIEMKGLNSALNENIKIVCIDGKTIQIKKL